MKTLTDYLALSRKNFWKQIAQSTDAERVATELWHTAELRRLTQNEAVECLDNLFVYSHQRIAERENLLAVYPTKQFSRRRLSNVEDLWWTDHFTAGISKWATLNWFSAAKRTKKSGKIGYAGASTHFVQGYHGFPFYIIPLMHGAWHEPHRNADSISIEFVNAGGVIFKKASGCAGQWHYWAREIPQRLVQELPPVQLDRPHRGMRAMQPFTHAQMVNAITLKRIVIAALNAPGHVPRLDISRFSQHSDWRTGKTDMGPLWRFDDINSAAFETIPVEEYAFVQDDEYGAYLDNAGTRWEEADGLDDEEELRGNPSYNDEDTQNDGSVLTITQVQQYLGRWGYTCVVDGKMGKNTRKQLKAFQKSWNSNNEENLLKVDGIPGPLTSAVLKRN